MIDDTFKIGGCLETIKLSNVITYDYALSGNITTSELLNVGKAGQTPWSEFNLYNS